MGQLLLIGVLGIYVTNLGYLFDGSFQQLKDYQFVSKALGGATATHSEPNNRFCDSILGYIPVPFPVDYVHGIDLQKLDFEGERWSYAGGVQQKRGWWWWYLYAMAVKVPHGTMLIVVMAGLTSWVMRPKKGPLTLPLSPENGGEGTRTGLLARRDLRGDWLVLVPALCILVLGMPHQFSVTLHDSVCDEG